MMGSLYCGFRIADFGFGWRKIEAFSGRGRGGDGTLRKIIFHPQGPEGRPTLRQPNLKSAIRNPK
jgi:hypothetical protein